MTVWVTADNHFGHANIIRHCNRPFQNVEEMNRTMIENINECVLKQDKLYVIGDFSFRGGRPKDYLDEINCKNVILIRGNHDNRKDEEGFSEVHDYLKIKHGKNKIIMFHYPMMSWECSFHGSVHFFGHVHGNLNGKTKGYNMLDVGVDSHEFKPLKIDDAINIVREGI